MRQTFYTKFLFATFRFPISEKETRFASDIPLGQMSRTETVCLILRFEGGFYPIQLTQKYLERKR